MKKTGAKKARITPHSPEAERGLLGCVLACAVADDANRAMELMDATREMGITPEWFYDGRHAALWETFLKLDDEGKPVTFLTVAGRLREHDMLDAVGGLAGMNEIANLVPSPAAWPTHAKTLLAKWRMRGLLNQCRETAEKIYEVTGDDDAVHGILGDHETALGRLSDPASRKADRHIKDVLHVTLEGMEKYFRGKAQLHGLSTGFTYLDKVIQGIDAEHYFVLAGRPGDGKTSLALDVVRHVAVTLGLPVGVFSLEMGEKSLGMRLLFAQAHGHMGRWNTGFATAEDMEKLVVANTQLSQANIWLDFSPRQTMGQIRSTARRWVRQHGIKLVVIDYIQLIRPDTTEKFRDRQQELTDISATLMEMKRSLQVPILVLAQMNRNIEQAESKRTPVLSDLRDCGAIEQDADVVGFLYKPSLKQREQRDEILEKTFPTDYDRPNIIDFYVAKNRFGPTGNVQMLFHRNETRFEDWREWAITRGHEKPAAGEAMPKPEQDNFVDVVDTYPKAIQP